MREIKFRGKGLYDGRWYYGDLLHDENLTSISFNVDNSNVESVKMTVIPETVGQFTGFYDEVGAEIYDGDIFTTRNGYNYFVVFENGSFECYHCNYRDTVNGGMLRWGLLSRAYELVSEFTPKKIGSIHDNPELLK